MEDRLLLPPEPRSAAKARSFARDYVAASGSSADPDVVELLVSELVTNAVLHARTSVIVNISTARGGIRVEVADEAVGSVAQRHYSPDATTGRGVGLVDVLASDWGVRSHAYGKTVWFEVIPRVAAKARQ